VSGVVRIIRFTCRGEAIVLLVSSNNLDSLALCPRSAASHRRAGDRRAGIRRAGPQYSPLEGVYGFGGGCFERANRLAGLAAGDRCPADGRVWLGGLGIDVHVATVAGEAQVRSALAAAATVR